MRWDVVVVGAGTAGMPAAIAAAENGARVLVLDKEPRVGGMLHISGGQFSGAGTRRQRERGIVDDVQQHLEDVERLSHGKANSALVRESVLRQGEMVAVGELLGASQFMGDNFVGGMSVGPCIALGRMLGQRLAKRQPVGSARP
jgi:fumarate reductase flavoprotein subunit